MGFPWLAAFPAGAAGSRPWGVVWAAAGFGFGVLGALVAVKVRLRALAAARGRREATLHGILNAVQETIWLFDTEGRLLLGNEVALRRFGRGAGELIGRTILEVTEPVLARTRMSRLEEVIASGRPLVTEDARDGIHFRHSWFPILDSQGRVTQVAVFSADITARKRTEAELERAFQEAEAGRRMLAALMEHVPEGIAIVDGGAFKMVSRHGQELLGADGLETARQILARLELFHADGETPLTLEELPLTVALRRGEAVRNVELVQRDATGRRLSLLCHAAPIRDEAGVVQGGIVAWHEIGELKAAQDALRRTVAELERSNRELAQFAYVSSHDLQEPLRQVLAYVDRLRHGAAGAFEGKAAQWFAFVEEGAARMSALVKGVLDYARLGEEGRSPQAVACEEALASALANLEGSLLEADAVVTHDELPRLLGEPSQLVQLFQNLLGNALKFRREGVPARIHVGCRAEPGVAHFRVEDNGIGIEPRYYGKIFLLFQRLHDREQIPGTGIGLALCKKIVEQHGGAIWVEAAEGGGTAFHFRLPV